MRKSRIKNRMAGKKAMLKEKGKTMKERITDKVRKGKGAAVAALLAFAVSALTGCQTADPASRSNRTSYGDITVVADNGSTVGVTIGDGTVADASGGGDSNENTATQTTDTKPEVAVGVGGGSAGTGGASPSSGIVGKALEKLMGISGGSGQKLTPGEAAAIRDCVDGNCSD